MVLKAFRGLFPGRTRPGRQRLSGRPRPGLGLELLEDRLLLSSTRLPLLLPVYPANQSPFGNAVADLPTAETTALYRLILGREPEAAGQDDWTARLQAGTSRVDVVDGFLKSPEYTTNLVEGYYATLLGRPAE